MRRFIKMVFVLALFALLSNTINAQTEKMQSVFIYNFISKFVEWPAADKTGDFIIGVLGDSPIVAELNALAAAKTVGAQKIVVKKFGSAGEISKCHVLYIPSSQAGQLSAASSKGGSTLVVASSDDACKKGAAINFVLVDNKQKFELKKSNATGNGLKISPDLEKMAIIIN